MKESPILMSGPMVRAILEDRKGQTRRIVKPYEWFEGHLIHSCMGPLKPGEPSAYEDLISSIDGGIQKRCPYGSPGDRLWVKETFGVGRATGWTYYRADWGDGDVINGNAKRNFFDAWKPSLFMPRNRSRITLEITGIRVERVQEISEEDAVAEGCEHPEMENIGPHFMRGVFQGVWEHINGADSWAANPWVWVVEFRRIKP